MYMLYICIYKETCAQPLNLCPTKLVDVALFMQKTGEILISVI